VVAVVAAVFPAEAAPSVESGIDSVGGRPTNDGIIQ
jgi:hypothetical protein